MRFIPEGVVYLMFWKNLFYWFFLVCVACHCGHDITSSFLKVRSAAGLGGGWKFSPKPRCETGENSIL